MANISDFMNVPSSTRAQSTPEKVAHAKVPSPPLGGVRGFVTDHSLKPSHESEHVLMSSHEPYNHISSHPKPLTLAAHAPFILAALGPLGRKVLRGERSHFFSSDDNAFSKQIVATHASKINELEVKPILSVIEGILLLRRHLTAENTLGSQVQAHTEAMDKKILQEFICSVDPDSKIILCNCAGGGESHKVTMDLLRALSSFSWDAKVVITFAAFAINYGDQLQRVEHLHTTNLLAKNIATLKDLPDMTAHAVDLKKMLEYVLHLFNMVVKGTHCIIEFKKLPSMNISPELQEVTIAKALIPTTVYWIIRSILVCASKLMNLIESGQEYVTSTAKSWEILGLAHKLSVLLDNLQNQLKICRESIERKTFEDAYLAFQQLMETTYTDNMKVLRAMINSRDDQRPLYDGSKKTNERLEMLKHKYVLLLISDFEFSKEELNILHFIYNQHTMGQEYEVLWLPILDSAVSKSGLRDPIFYDLRNNMPWYSVDHPSLVKPVAIKYIKEVWKFIDHMPMLVVLDPQGKPSNLDALPMIWIWASAAFPFTKARERILWSESAWNIELLADNIDPRIQEWIRDNKIICLYGSEDIHWIQEFTVSAHAAAHAVQVPLEMLYVGKRNPKYRVRFCHEVIDREKLSHVFSKQGYYDYVWYFWFRLWSMWNSKNQLGMTVKNDVIMQEIIDILTFGSSTVHGWAVFSRGNYEMTKGTDHKLMDVFKYYYGWIHQVDHPDKFVRVLDKELRHGYEEDVHFNRLILPGHARYVPEELHCSECGKLMDEYVMYCCCTD